jgi:hypothetical protein
MLNLVLFLILACGDKETEDTAQTTGDIDSSSDSGSDTDSDTDTEDNSEDAIEALSEGDLIITEIMKNPCGLIGEPADNGSQDCIDPQISDEAGEWFEIYNMSGVEINLNGLMVTELIDDNSDTEEDVFVVSEDVIVAVGAFVVFGLNNDVTLNGGANIDYVYSGMGLANGSDSIVLKNGNGIIDSVLYDDGVGFHDRKGASLSLDQSNFNSEDNDSGASWCQALSVMSSGDLGTPGINNDPC